MGYMCHHAIIVTSWQDALLDKAHKKATKLFHAVSPLIPSPINSYKSFLVPPDGSKEGWEDSDKGNANRKAFLKWLNAQRYEDGSTALQWVEVQYGDDNRETIVVSHSDEAAPRE